MNIPIAIWNAQFAIAHKMNINPVFLPINVLIAYNANAVVGLP